MIQDVEPIMLFWVSQNNDNFLKTTNLRWKLNLTYITKTTSKKLQLHMPDKCYYFLFCYFNYSVDYFIE